MLWRDGDGENRAGSEGFGILREGCDFKWVVIIALVEQRHEGRGGINCADV